MKRAFVAAVLFAFLIWIVPPAAAQTTGDTQKKGSIVAFPLIDVSGNRDTMVSITNYTYQVHNIACFYRDSCDRVQPFTFIIEAMIDPTFSAKNGDAKL